MLFTNTKSALIVALALCVPLGVGSYSTALAGEDFARNRGLGQYQTEIHRAVQQALRDKGYYSGAIDGQIGPMTRQAFLKFRADRRISRPPSGALNVDDDVVRELFGLQNSGIGSWEDEWCLLSKLGRESGEVSANACGGSTMAREDRQQEERAPNPVHRPPTVPPTDESENEGVQPLERN